MLSIVKLNAGWRPVRDGAGGSAPKHVQQLQAENHLRWTPGRVLRARRKLQVPGPDQGQCQAAILGDAVEVADAGCLDHDRSPGRKAGEPDNLRQPLLWFARYWAEALAAQTEDATLAAHFAPIAQALAEQEATILEELHAGRDRPRTRVATTPRRGKDGRDHAPLATLNRHYRLTRPTVAGTRKPRLRPGLFRVRDMPDSPTVRAVTQMQSRGKFGGA